MPGPPPPSAPRLWLPGSLPACVFLHINFRLHRIAPSIRTVIKGVKCFATHNPAVQTSLQNSSTIVALAHILDKCRGSTSSIPDQLTVIKQHTCVRTAVESASGREHSRRHAEGLK